MNNITKLMLVFAILLTVSIPVVLGQSYVASNIITGTVGSRVTYGQLLYQNSNGKYYLAESNSSTTLPVVGLAIGTIASNHEGLILLYGLAHNSTWEFTSGNRLYISSSTPGAISASAPTTSGSKIQSVGFALNATTIFFQPNYGPIVTNV